MQNRIKKDIKLNYQAYLMLLPAIVLVLVFAYMPMGGIVMAFQKYRPKTGILGSEWAGFTHFIDFFSSPHSLRVVRNTVMISLYSIIVNFPGPIILALLFNELKNGPFKKSIQTISYMPYFISTVVIAGMIKAFFAYDGPINELLGIFGSAPSNLLNNPTAFPSVIVFSDLWQSIGWNSIIYMAALSSIDTQLYEAARIDGCGRFKQIWHITIPSIIPTMTVLLILSVGGILSANSDEILLLYQPLTYETGDVIGTFIYRRGVRGGDYSFTTAVGLFQSVINFVLVIFANWFSKKTTENSLW